MKKFKSGLMRVPPVLLNEITTWVSGRVGHAARDERGFPVDLAGWPYEASVEVPKTLTVRLVVSRTAPVERGVTGWYEWKTRPVIGLTVPKRSIGQESLAEEVRDVVEHELRHLASDLLDVPEGRPSRSHALDPVERATNVADITKTVVKELAEVNPEDRRDVLRLWTGGLDPSSSLGRRMRSDWGYLVKNPFFIWKKHAPETWRTAVRETWRAVEGAGLLNETRVERVARALVFL